MSFLAPLFLVGIALVAGPILFHLMRQAPRNRVVFSSTELLEPSQPKRQKSRRIQNPWLLLVRCLIIALLAFAFARPFIPSDSQNESQEQIRRDVVIAIDASASMGRSHIRENVIRETGSIIEALNPYDQLSVFTFTDTIDTLVSVEQWSSLSPEQRKSFARDRLDDWAPRSLPGKLDRAVSESVSLVEALKERSSDSGFSEVFLVSDFSEGTSLSGIELIDWPPAMRVNRVSILPDTDTPNLSLRWINWAETDDGELAAQLAINTSQPNQRSNLSISLRNGLNDSLIGEPTELVMEDEAERIILLPINRSLQNVPLTFSLEGDLHTFDNQLPIAPKHIPEITIGLLSDFEVRSERAAPYFIDKAVQGFETPLAQVDTQSPLSPINQTYIIDRSLDSGESSILRGEIEKGKNALVLANSIEMADTLKNLTGSQQWKIDDRSQSGSLLVGEVDFDHTLFAPFASPRFSNFANINTWQAPEVAAPPSAKVLARFDDESPLLVEVKVGQGTLYVWAGGWAPEASQWVLSSKFIPFLHRFILQASGGPALPSNIPLTSDNIELYKNLLQGRTVDSVGTYEVSDSPGRWIAFQATIEESKTNPIVPDLWDQLALPEFEDSVAQEQVERIRNSIEKESAVRIEQRQHIWQWLLWLVLALLAVESLLAMAKPRAEAVTTS